MSDQAVADLYAYVKTKPAVSRPGEWHWGRAPETAPLGHRLYMNTVGCGQCHEPENKYGRMWLGERAKEVDYEYFSKVIYEHTEKFPRGNMGNYSREKVPESTMREIYKWMVEDLGLRPSIAGSLSINRVMEGNTEYNLTLANKGVKNIGLAALAAP